MGRLREQPQGEVLPADARRPEANRARDARMGADHRNPGALPCAARAGVMRRARALLLRLAAVVSPSRRDQDLARELESHLQMHVDDNMRAGMSPEEARRRALIQLGGVVQTTERYRDRERLPVIDALRRI